MKSNYLVLLLLAITSYSSCRKAETPQRRKMSISIQDARSYFETKLAKSKPTSGTTSSEQPNGRRQIPRKPIWEKAYLATLSFGVGVIVPVKYDNSVIITSNFAGTKFYDINELTKVFIYQDRGGQYHYDLITAFPDSTYKSQDNEAFKGLLFIEDWNGNFKNRFKYVANGGVLKYNNTQTVSTASSSNINLNNRFQLTNEITVCYEVGGYNYPASQPDSGYYWSEPAGCQMYNYSTDDPGSGTYGGDSPTSGDYGTIPTGTYNGAGGYPINPVRNMSVLGGNNIIGNIKDYNKCFINTPGSDHSYKVQLCVSQPVPGTRNAWGFDDPNNASANGNPIYVGHTFFVLTETTPTRTITRNVGFYPKNSASPFSPSDNGQLNNDEVHEYDISLTVTLTSHEFFNILDFVEQGNSAGYMYNLNSNNCTTFAVNAFSRIGINLPRTAGSWATGGGLNPGDLGEDIRSLKLSSNMSRSTVYNPHPNQGICY